MNSFLVRLKLANNYPTGRTHRINVDMSRTKFWRISTSFTCIFWYNFADWKIHVVSTYIFRWSKNSHCFHVLFLCNFAGRKIHVVSTCFFWRNFTGRNYPRIFHVLILLVKIFKFFSTYFFRCNFDGRKTPVVSVYVFDVISLVEISTLCPITFFDVTLMVEKSSFRQNFDRWGKLQGNENIRGGFSLLLILKSWLLQNCSA